MGKLTMTAFVTLDGVMQAPGGPNEDQSGGFEHGGWLVPYVDEAFLQFVAEVFSRADAFLLGRRTYEIFAAHWPRVTDVGDPIATALNALPKHVASKTLERLDWNASSPVRDVVTEVPKIKARVARELQVHGSPGLAQTLLRHGLVDELHVVRAPVVLGRGKRLFEAGTPPAALKHSAARTTSTGVMITTYVPAGVPTFGSFELAPA